MNGVQGVAGSSRGGGVPFRKCGLDANRRDDRGSPKATAGQSGRPDWGMINFHKAFRLVGVFLVLGGPIRSFTTLAVRIRSGPHSDEYRLVLSQLSSEAVQYPTSSLKYWSIPPHHQQRHRETPSAGTKLALHPHLQVSCHRRKGVSRHAPQQHHECPKRECTRVIVCRSG